ncbi:Caspase-8 isoform X1 [Pristimantis euphronides]
MSDIIHYRTLYKITEELESSNTSELTFLCQDLIPKQPRNGKEDTHLFTLLHEMNYIDENNTSLIEELLFYLKRYDLLLKHFKVTKSTMVERMKNPAMAQISPYRCLLHELGNLVPNSKVEEIKFNFTDILPQRTLEKVTSLWDLFIELEKKDKIKKENLNYLKQMSHYINDDFKQLILEYEEKTAAALGSITTDDGSHTNSRCRTDESELSSAFYNMNSKTRGICLIISNHSFSKARRYPGQQHFKDRKGTKKDEESLCKVFSKLNFQVDIMEDLEGNQIVETINSYRDRNHTENDCFICCILSHGDRGIIYGTDGHSVPIRDLTGCFCNSQCSTLSGKPKLFFIQACQGKELQQLVPLHTDACNASAGNSFSKCLIPEEPDFLLGMATTSLCVSYREPNHGSWYIQSLCKQLQEGHQSKDDIISILTKVNRELSQKHVHSTVTQMPQPWTTLTRKLFFY